MDEEITIQALGRHSFLGQLYNIQNAQLSNISLFRERDMLPPVTITTPVPRTEVEFKVVKNSEDRAHLLSVNAAVSVSLLGGTVKISGFGDYLDRSDSSEESTNITGIARHRTVHQRLDLSNRDFQESKGLSNEQITSLRATHVVTAITYGGTLIGSFSETKSHSAGEKKIAGGFKLSAMQQLASFASAEGSLDLSDVTTDKSEYSKLDISFVADTTDPDRKIPVTAVELIAAIEHGMPKLSADVEPKEGTSWGVPVELILTPISRFDQFSVELLFRELDEADLVQMRKLYDSVKTLSEQTTTLQREVEKSITDQSESYAKLFPSFFAKCQTQSQVVKTLLTVLQGDMGQFLMDYRKYIDSGNNETAGLLISRNQQPYLQQKHAYELNIIEWQTLRQQVYMAQQHLYPLYTTSLISKTMANQLSRTIVVVLIPATASKISLLNTYRVIGDKIKTWLTPGGVSDPPPESAPPKDDGPIYLSFYADPLLDTNLLKLEGTTGSIAYALQEARKMSKASFLMYSRRPSSVTNFQWTALGHNNWGFQIDQESGTMYIGDFKDGLPHGLGVMTYINGTTYNGNWLFGKRDGNGRLTLDVEGSQSHILEDGKWMDDRVIRDSRRINSAIFTMDGGWGPEGWIPLYEKTCVVHVMVIHNMTNVFAQETFCVLINDSTPLQVEKIAAVFGWKEGERHELIPVMEKQIDGGPIKELQSPFKVITNGSRVEVSPYGNEDPPRPWAWPNDEVDFGDGHETLRVYYYKYQDRDRSWSNETGWTTFQDTPIKIKAMRLD